MSWEATNWAVKQLAGSPGAKIVLLLLADRADDKHSCWPSQDRLAVESEQSVATVRRRLRDLETMGLIWTERRNVPGMKRATNRYFLAVISSGQSDNQSVSRGPSTAQTDDLPLKSDDIYRSPVSAKPSSEPPVEEPPKDSRTTQSFAEFWKAYPRKKDKGQAARAFMKALGKVDAAVIIAAAVQFRQWCEQDGTEPKFIPHASTWLNGERWLDERDPAPMSEHERRKQGHIALIQELWETDNSPKPQQLEG